VLETAPVKETEAKESLSLLNAFCTKGKDFLTLYKNKENPYIQEFKLTARMQYQLGGVSGDEEFLNTPSMEEEWRRFRLGAQLKFLERFTLTNIWNIGGLDARGGASGGVYSDNQTDAWIYELNLAYQQPDMFIATAGKMKPRITGEYRTSSSQILTVERSAIVNQLRPETNWGFQLQNPGKDDAFQWVVGAYSNFEDGDYGESWDWNSGMGLISLSYKADEILLKKGRVWLDYMFTNQNMFTAPGSSAGYYGVNAKDFWALTYEGKQDEWYLLVDGIVAKNLKQRGPNGDNADSAFGLNILPAYSFNRHWQAVGRYSYAYSNDGGLRMDSRYVSTFTPNTRSIESMHGFYAGMNYYVCADNPHMAKIMMGVEYITAESLASNRKGFDGFQYMISFRTNF